MHCVKINLEKGAAKVPLWAALTVVISILVAVAGIAYGWVQKSADVEHRLLLQELRTEEQNRLAATALLDHRVTDDETMLTKVVGTNSDLARRIAAIETQTRYIPQILRILMDGKQ